jgi:hypothetical protein
MRGVGQRDEGGGQRGGRSRPRGAVHTKQHVATSLEELYRVRSLFFLGGGGERGAEKDCPGMDCDFQGERSGFHIAAVR